LFVQRCVNFFHQPYGEYDKGGKFENSTCNFLQAIGNVDDFLKQDFEIIKVEAFSLDASEIAPAKEKLQFVPMISYLSSFSDNVEVTDQNAQKGLILEKVAKLKNLSKDEIVVIGDGMNDLTMFQHFPYAFAPANADLEIQNLAYQIVADCEDDGFAEVIDIIFKDLM
ncbi:MAG: HAD hydrolase family protein, partial [Coprobacillus cateniformis]